MRASLIRVGVDQAFGHWNAPADPDSRAFVYVPIPEGDRAARTPDLATPYSLVLPGLASFAAQARLRANEVPCLPVALRSRSMHLDPDFDHMTYGDNGEWRGAVIRTYQPGDLVVFFAGLRPVRPCRHRLIYALLGLFTVSEVILAGQIPQERWHENAHTRRSPIRPTDVVVRGDPARSGRLRRFIEIGEWRRRAYRVREDLLEAWGGLSSHDGYIQRSAVPPRFIEPDRFQRWLDTQGPELEQGNGW